MPSRHSYIDIFSIICIFVFSRSARERTRFCGWFQHQGKWLVMRKPALVMWSCFKAAHMWLSLHKQHNPTCDYQTRTSRRCAQALLSLAAAPWTREFASLLLLVATWRRLGSFWLTLSIEQLARWAVVWDDDCNSLIFQNLRFRSSQAGWATMEILTLTQCWRLRTKKRYCELVLENVSRFLNRAALH